jgi:hypothetical protein
MWYSDARSCQRRPGSKGYEELDARTFAEWEIDFLKVFAKHPRFRFPKNKKFRGEITTAPQQVFSTLGITPFFSAKPCHMLT